ncbi:MAG TPA: hypothetical protein VGG08_07065 [Solirubrobacteraceae bacterium]
MSVRSSRLTAVVVILIGVFASAATATHGHSRCAPISKKTVTHDRVAEVYYAFDGEITGCVYALGKPYRLGPGFEALSQGSHGLEDFVLNGIYVAYEQIHAPFEPDLIRPASFYVVVRNLRTGNIVHREPTGASSDPTSIGLGSARRLVVSKTGAVAWSVIDYRTYCHTDPTLNCVQVRVIDSRGGAVVAEAQEPSRGVGIEANSLTLHAGVISWEQNEALRHFVLR